MKLKYLAQIKEGKGKSAAIFKLKDKVLGPKKPGNEAVTMIDPETGQSIVERDELKEAPIKNLSGLLTNRKPKEQYKNQFELLEKIHSIRMEEEIGDDEEFTEKDFNELLIRLQKKNKDKYKYILKAGHQYKYALFHLIMKVWKMERKPIK